MNELGIENVFVYTGDNKSGASPQAMLEFFQKQFAKVK